jgi:hypothetical protein
VEEGAHKVPLSQSERTGEKLLHYLHLILQHSL